MTSRRSGIALIAWGLSLVVIPGQAQRGPAPDPLVREGVTQKLSAHVFVIPDASVPLVPNVGIIVGSRATLVVDTGMGARNGAAVVREMRKVSRTPEVYLVTTHVHPEHDLGAGGFPPEVKMVRSRDQVQEIAETGLALAKTFAGFSPLNAELLRGAEFRKADVTFDREHTLDLGDVRARIVAMGFNHTRGDTVVFVEGDGVLFSGDVAMDGLPAFPAQGSSVARWLASLDRLDALRPSRVVPSHGPVGDAQFMAGYRAYFTAIRTRAAEAKGRGLTQDQAVDSVSAALESQYPRNRMAAVIRTAYAEQP